MRRLYTAPPCLAVAAHPSRKGAGFFRDPAGAQERPPQPMRPAAADGRSKRTTALLVRLSPEERRAILARAQACGKGTSTYMREVALGSIPRCRPRRLEEEAVYQLARLGNNVNQLARVANTTGQIEDSRLLAETLGELLRATRSLM